MTATLYYSYVTLADRDGIFILHGSSLDEVIEAVYGPISEQVANMNPNAQEAIFVAAAPQLNPTPNWYDSDPRRWLTQSERRAQAESHIRGAAQIERDAEARRLREAEKSKAKAIEAAKTQLRNGQRAYQEGAELQAQGKAKQVAAAKAMAAATTRLKNLGVPLK